MKFCSKCGKEILEEAVICPHCGCATGANNPVTAPIEEDKANVGLCIFSALFPIFGIIYWPVKYKVTPKCATACGVTAIISWILWVLLYSFILYA